MPGRDYTLSDLRPLDEAQVQDVGERFESQGLAGWIVT